MRFLVEKASNISSIKENTYDLGVTTLKIKGLPTLSRYHLISWSAKEICLNMEVVFKLQRFSIKKEAI